MYFAYWLFLYKCLTIFKYILEQSVYVRMNLIPLRLEVI